MDIRKRGLTAYRKTLHAPETPPAPSRPEEPAPADSARAAPTRVSKSAASTPRGGLIRTIAGEKSCRKVAKFLLLIGKEQAADVLKHLGEAEVERVSAEIARIKRVEPAEAQKILGEFGFRKKAPPRRSGGGVETARTMLVAAFGEEAGRAFLLRSLPPEVLKTFAFLGDYDPRRVYGVLKEEPAGALSIIMEHLDAKTASVLLECFDPSRRAEIVRWMAKKKRVNAEVLSRIEQALREKIRRASLAQDDPSAAPPDGAGILAEILKYMGYSDEAALLERLEDERPDLAEDVKERLFTIESIEFMPERDLQSVLRDLSDRDLALLLKGKSDRIREKVLINVSERRRSFIAEEYKLLGAVARRDVDAATRDFVEKLKKLEQDGSVTFYKRGDVVIK